MLSYRHATIDVVAGRVREYLDALGEVYAPIAAARHSPYVGVFQVAATSGRWPQVIVITAVDELASRAAVTETTSDPMLDEWNSTARQFRVNAVDQRLTLLPFSPVPPAAPNVTSSGRVFFQQTCVARAGGAGAFVKCAATTLVPRAAEEGVKLEAFWRSAHQPLEHIAVWSLPDWDTFARMQVDRDRRVARGEESIPGFELAWDIVDDVQERLLMPAVFSPLGGGEGSLVVTI
jgi:hypothetical protein